MTRVNTGTKVVINPFKKKKESDCGCKKKGLPTISKSQTIRDSTK